MRDLIRKAIELVPEVAPLLSERAREAFIKAAPISRDEMERKLARAILAVDRRYLAILEANDGVLPFGYWQNYEDDLRRAISSPLRQQIEQSFTSYSEYVNWIDKTGAVTDIDTAMTKAIDEITRGISANTRANLEGYLRQGITGEELIEKIALRFSSGHAEQVAITELTRAEAHFSDALAARLSEQGVASQIRWLTSEDEKVCPICAPLDHKLRGEGGWMTKAGMIERPPAHPNCRCQTVVELPKRKPSV